MLTILTIFPMLLGAECTDAARDLGTVVDATAKVRAVVMGDFGDPGNRTIQEQVAKAIRDSHGASPFSLGLTLGDNFYSKGVKNIKDPRWKSIWEEDYGILRVPFFAALGNHDYKGNAQAQIDFTTKCQDKQAIGPSCTMTWKMPCNYYTYTAGPVQFFALDTDEGTSEKSGAIPLSNGQLQWLKSALAKHKDARWKIAYGHHPAYTDGYHGKDARVKEVRNRLLPVLKEGGVQMYVAGHDHDLQYRVTDGMAFPVIGGGGRDNENRKREANDGEFWQLAYGFAEIEATASELSIRIIGRGADGKFNALYSPKPLQ